ncbi:MAG TPA: ChaN family lipoprotein, partial [Desulfuromonadales bacterium]
MRHLKFLLPLLALPLAAGCALGPQLSGNPEAPYPPARPPAVGDILHIPTGYYVSEEQMLAVATDARIVYVGETHDNPASHRLELTLLRAMAERYPGGVALGMEMFTPDQQETLDRWVSGELTEKEFLKQSRWQEQWQMDFEYYQPLLAFARERHIPVIGLNAPKSLVKSTAREDLGELSDEERRRLPEMDREDPYHGAFVTAMYSDHGHGNSGLEGFRRVQTLWDETMAESITRYLVSPAGNTRRMVVVAGGNHIRHGFGIPRRVFRRLPTSYILIGSKELDIPEDKRDRLMDVEVPRFPMPPYDFLAFTEYEDLARTGVRLGVMLEEAEGKVRVKAVLPNSAAEAAGL